MITNTCPICNKRTFEYTINEVTYSRCNNCNINRPVINGTPRFELLN